VTRVLAPVVAQGVEPLALSLLKYGLLVLLFLFIWRAMRWVLRGLAVESPAGAGPTRGRRAAAADASAPPPSTLLLHPPDGGRPKAIPLDTSTTIGRGAGCELRIDDTYASSEHARIFGRGDAWYVEDLGSTNGTFVNEQRLAAPAMLAPGDKIRVGTTVMELRR
jgi:pSer/pThr/pTyr-binding forkhead associated (FHA) protein